MSLRAKFFKDPDKGIDFVEISAVGDPCDIIRKVTTADVQRFPNEWSAYQNGQDTVDYGGTPLTEVPGINANLAMAFKLKNVHNAEMLADLSDAAALSLGLNGLTFRNTALLLIQANGRNDEPVKRRGRPPKAQADESAIGAE
jgi:hypothetical protein